MVTSTGAEPPEADTLDELLLAAVGSLVALAQDGRRGPRERIGAGATAASLLDRLGRVDEARALRAEARDQADQAALALGVEDRQAFLDDPCFAGIAQRDPGAPEGRTARSDGDGGLRPRVARLLDILKRLAGEQRLERLLPRITDAAVELGGAERGFVLLVGADGQLASAAEAGGAPGAHEFSRTIAEAVLIDGEPIVTVDARQDPRFGEFRSVHQLHLRSVAAIPIRGTEGPVGVLYLEHRGARGRFAPDELALLSAFADQAAIAVEGARLAASDEARRRELEAALAAVEAAKEETVRVLHARTEALESTRKELSRTRSELGGEMGRHGLIGRSPAMRRVFALIDRVAEVGVPVVIEGESGTGKELVARAIHRVSARRDGPFVPVNCGAIPEPLLESELFGHVRGAFTGAEKARKGVFERATGGTLFLDEAAEMPAKMKVDLLRVLAEAKVRPVGADEDRPVDVRVLVATAEPLQRLVSERRFREDLFYRLDVVRVPLPPLRERGQDLPLLCDHLLRTIAAREGGPRKRLAPEALARLRSHSFPGNVRELEHLLLGAWVLAEGTTIGPEHLGLDGDRGLDGDAGGRGVPPEAVRPTEEPPASGDEAPSEEGRPPDVQTTPPAPGGGSSTPPDSEAAFKARERARILEALERHGWNRARAARSLGMPRRTFYRRLSAYGIR